jgi:hypothetical protein
MNQHQQHHRLAAAFEQAMYAIAQGVVAEWKDEPALKQQATNARSRAAHQVAKGVIELVSDQSKYSPAGRHPSNRPVSEVLSRNAADPNLVTRATTWTRQQIAKARSEGRPTP